MPMGSVPAGSSGDDGESFSGSAPLRHKCPLAMRPETCDLFFIIRLSLGTLAKASGHSPFCDLRMHPC